MRTLWLMIVFTLCGSLLQAEEVRLRNGDVISGEIISMDAKSLKIASENFGELTIARERIAMIRFGQQSQENPLSLPTLLPPTPEQKPTLSLPRYEIPRDQPPVPQLVPPAPSVDPAPQPNYIRPGNELLKPPPGGSRQTSGDWLERLKSTFAELSSKENEATDPEQVKSLSKARQQLMEATERALKESEKRLSEIISENFRPGAPVLPPATEKLTPSSEFVPLLP